MPIDYSQKRPLSADMTALMRRINAVEDGVRIPRWSSGGVLFTSKPASNLSCDFSGFIYISTAGNIDKLAYSGGSDVVGLVSTGNVNGQHSTDANTLWTPEGNELIKYDLDGVELLRITKIFPPPSQAQDVNKYWEVQHFSGGGIVAIYQHFDNSSGNLRRFDVRTYNSDGTGETTILSETHNIGAENKFANIVINEDDEIIISTIVSGVRTSKRFNRTGTLLDTIPTPVSDGFDRQHAILSGNEITTFGSAGIKTMDVFDQDGTLIYTTDDLDMGASANYFNSIVDENGNLYYTTRVIGTLANTFTSTAVSSDGFYVQSEFFRYPDRGANTNSESLGTPDGGVSIPASGALLTLSSGQVHRPHAQTLNDMRAALESVAPFYINGATGNPFVVSGASADNIFTVAISAVTDWTSPTVTSASVTPATSRMRVTDMSDMDLVLIELEASDLV